MCSLGRFSNPIQKYLEGRGHASVLTENALPWEQCLTNRCKIMEGDEKSVLWKHSVVSHWESHTEDFLNLILFKLP